ncbi:MAG: hypothetical protein K2H39_08470, partial [Paramuribaculum sp.]|nr:hypothetical protein [Paramuribaculum sp.]
MPVGVKKILSVITVSVCASVSFAQDNSTVSRENWTYVSPYYDSDSNWWTDFGDSTLDSLI